MSFTKFKSGLWFMFAWFSTETYSLTYFVIVTFTHFFFLFWKFVKNDNLSSFLRCFYNRYEMSFPSYDHTKYSLVSNF